ncbi:type III restriction enzyme, res subunit [Peptoniphilus duerdenii ATCC BAA-1640]|uniref:Type III restriction enzyme, res subunit n=1 Tax=Peptoniphilus duerdenii ATCC BAA-1640 TaxID=862517 RepID=E0NJT8_9FIRM|nr:DEAD/DEAH box helicase family protein [Peptoniphilus duerdenii]EFM25883.1 type III restriction enzyme, res subunit [Peptoniphilus duerdenii ATCC BAA-1640]
MMTAPKIDTTKAIIPICYAYTTPGVTYHEGWTKIGFTERDADTRIREQVTTAGIKYNLEWQKNAIFEGTNETFRDSDFHKYLENNNIKREAGLEWFKIDPLIAKNKFDEFKENRGITKSNIKPVSYKLREEQEDAVQKTIEYFKNNLNPEFLWNAKPRFGKTLTAYDLCLKMGFKKILILTNRPAIAKSWYDDYIKFIGPDADYFFISRVDAIKDEKYVFSREEYLDRINANEIKGFIEFVSLQDLKGSIYFGGDKTKLKEVHDIDWDILIIDEAHEGVDTYKSDQAFNQISRAHTLHLSGTPFKALANEKFPDDAIYNWTYADEQRMKVNWKGDVLDENPYEILPRLNLFTYQISDIIRDKLDDGINLDGEMVEYAFDLNEFFSTDERGAFIYNDDVDKFLDALTDENRTKFPFSTPELRNEIKHSFWILNRVDSAKALKRKLEMNPIFREYKVVLAAGDGKTDDEVITEESLARVKEAIDTYEKTITLSVGQLTTGITVPEWTAVLMLANMKSPSLYMQAAFRAQNPCLFTHGVNFLRKKNAYIFDFDPARTLDIFEKFANDLSPTTSAGGRDDDTRKKHVKELLNFFPVYGEDENGVMIKLDAEKVLSIPRKIKAVEVVNRGFMSNFLFANISNIFRAPEVVRETLGKLNSYKKPRDRQLPIDDSTADDLDLDENGEVRITDEKIVGVEQKIFGPKVYDEIENNIDQASGDLVSTKPPAKIELTDVVNTFSSSIVEPVVNAAKSSYENNLSRSTEKKIKKNIEDKVGAIVKKEYGAYEINKNKLEIEKQKELDASTSSQESTKIEIKYNEISKKQYEEFEWKVKEALVDFDLIGFSTKSTADIIENDIAEKKKRSLEDDIRDRLRGFSRTIPSFLMAYGDDNTTLANFDKIIPDDVFLDVTSITIDEFKELRDGFDYEDDKTGEIKHYEGNLFDERVFDDSVKEFLNKKNNLSNYFDENVKRDIFDYIPPQKTNQIFTPKKVVNEMLDLLEKENPGCFDNPCFTFIDPYMKSGLYITEIVKRLYRSEEIKKIYPERDERLNHIFGKQVYGLAPTEIIYKIASNFILGFSDDVNIQKHNLRLLDSLDSIQKDRFEKDLVKVYPEFEEDNNN